MTFTEWYQAFTAECTAKYVRNPGIMVAKLHFALGKTPAEAVQSVKTAFNG